ncbi:hypothetical protein Scep_029500 [Stephania cephalantha]|uniref:alpha-1,2-Mannosidase n=1 Tax=Stephania cephalantha TaxID=152367 RepID=A0AAP0DXS6_9MAGN
MNSVACEMPMSGAYCSSLESCLCSKFSEPQSKDGVNSFGGLGATLIDSLDTLFIMGLDEQFQKAKEWVATSLDFNKNYDASVFETTIRKRFNDKEDERQFIAFALAHAYFGHCWSLKRTYKVWNASLEWPRADIGYELRAFKILGNYEAAKVGFGAGKNMKTSTARAVYVCPFVDGGIKSVALSVGGWFFDQVGVNAIDCPYPCDNTCHNLVFK